jgi:Bifunctional DNA primase/polymerase, N-terminal
MRDDAGAVASALAYARQGWPVFPCKPGLKEPDTRHGFKDATTDPARIAAWWRAEPDRNVAIATGAPGPDVLDVDVRPGGNGYLAYDHLRRAGLLEGTLAVVATPSGGLHAYYTGSGQRSGRLPAWHLDFKAAGGYVLASPSQVGGRRYEVLEHRSHAEGARLDWAAAVTLLEPPPDRAPIAGRRHDGWHDTGRLAAWVAGLEEGNRNTGLFWAACRLAEAGQADDIDRLAEAARKTGLPDHEIQRTLDSAQRMALREQLREP